MIMKDYQWVIYWSLRAQGCSLPEAYREAKAS
jgi:hypothetical protein